FVQAVLHQLKQQPAFRLVAEDFAQAFVVHVEKTASHDVTYLAWVRTSLPIAQNRVPIYHFLAGPLSRKMVPGVPLLHSSSIPSSSRNGNEMYSGRKTSFTSVFRVRTNLSSMRR